MILILNVASVVLGLIVSGSFAFVRIFATGAGKTWDYMLAGGVMILVALSLYFSHKSEKHALLWAAIPTGVLVSLALFILWLWFLFKFGNSIRGIH